MPGPISRSSFSSYDTKSKEPANPGNPDPKRFRIDKHARIGNYLILCVVYPDCRNFEGKKVMVFKDLTIRQVENFESLDPHFSNSKDFASPIARFLPTMEGWHHARQFCKLLVNLK